MTLKEESELQYKHQDVGKLVTIINPLSSMESIQKLKGGIFSIVKVVTKFDYTDPNNPKPSGCLYMLDTTVGYLFSKNEFRIEV